MSAPNPLSFRRFGRSYHLKIETAEDLDGILDLDEAHWVATGAPVDTLHADPTLLDLVDVDGNRRILCYELVGAVRWLGEVLTDRTGVTAKSTSLKLAALNSECADGRSIRTAARKILTQSRAASDEITLEQVRRVKKEVEGTAVSEAGVVLAEAVEDAEVRTFLGDVLSTVGGVPHPSGTDGVSREKLERFLADAQAWLDWRARAEIPAGEPRTDIMPLGADTPAAYAAFAVLRDKIDQYFAQCRAVALDDTLVGRFGLTQTELDAMDLDDPAVIEQVLRDAPLVVPSAARTLAFAGTANPHYADALRAFRTDAAAPVLGKTPEKLTEDDWTRIRDTFAAHDAWLASKPGAAVEPLGVEKLAAYLDPRFRSAVDALIAQSADTAFVLDNIRLTEKCILYQAHLLDLTNNFVSFPDLYDEKRRAMFEMGTLVCDGRRFNMSVRVVDRTAHVGVAKTSNMYVLYVEITSRDGKERKEVAVPVTSGGKGNLCIGKRGVFIDVEGVQWDAKVIEIIENPISLREALGAPFKRIGKVLTGKLESITTEAEKKVDLAAAQAVPPVSTSPAAAPAPAPAPAPAKSGVAAGGMLMGAGVALAALGSALAYITKTLSEANPWAVLGVVGGAILAVLIPVSVLAVVKLRRRDLSAILEGSGWAINARMRLTRRQARYFTRRPKHP